MVFNTLNTIIDDIMLTIRNGHISESENISRLQVEQWIHTYRALLLKQDIDKDGDINPQYIQHLDGVQLEKVLESKIENEGVGNCVLETVLDIPKLLDLNNRDSILNITDMYGNVIQLGSRTKSKFQSYRKYTCADYIAYMKGNKIRINGPGVIEYINLDLIMEDPSKEAEINEDCDFANKPYPLPYDKIPTLKQMIFERELGIRLSVPSDLINNTKDDNVNEKAV